MRLLKVIGILLIGPIGVGGIVGGHMLQHVGCRLNRPLAHLVHADFVPTVFTSHMSAARYASDPDVHSIGLRSIGGWCRGHWDSNAGVVVRKAGRDVERLGQRSEVEVFNRWPQ
jgi:hypothetical protein